MKKILMLGFAMFFFCVIVNAELIDFDMSEDLPIYAQIDLGGGHYHSKYLHYIKRKDTQEYVYCLEPGVVVKNGYTQLSGYYNNALNLSSDRWDKIMAYAYFGYGYEGHEEDRYYFATQMLIWQEAIDRPIYFTSTIGGKRAELYVDEMNEIRTLSLKYINGPSLNKEIVLGPKDEVVLEDQNQTAEIYKLATHPGSTITFKDNLLTVKYKDAGDYTYQFESKKGIQKEMVYYFHEEGQDILGRGYLPTRTIPFHVTSLPTSVTIQKYGQEPKIEDKKIVYEKVPLENVVFELYASEDITTQSGKLLYEKEKRIKKLETNASGEVTVEDLPFGKYCIKEVSAPNHKINNEPTCFTLNQENTNVSYTFSNERIVHSLFIRKIDEESKEALEGAHIAIYSLNDELVFDGYTDANGLLEIPGLYQGSFYIKEITAPNGYLLLKEPILIEIKDEDFFVILENKKVPRIITVPNTGSSNVSFLSSLILLSGGIYFKKRYC